ncbi:MAG: hypothetical protein O4805_14085 [Trichodesmium sp. St16_bin2-tuft]|nr:hypothetical protein [Trichodesmium sp. St16_bin2-tuft]
MYQETLEMIQMNIVPRTGESSWNVLCAAIISPISTEKYVERGSLREISPTVNLAYNTMVS